jgi:uroporphyrin-III C-methyltransferase
MPPETRAGPGRVLLVGAGPGPADLMTVRAQRAVQQAQAVLYDALVDPEVLDLAPAACLKLQTGKRAGRASMDQDAIHRLMLTLARRGLTVVRLKGGDPSVFGRSSEEAAYLEAHGVEVEIVPGVTAASAAAAQFGFPLTCRRTARRLTLATVRVEYGELVQDGWTALAEPDTTLALYIARDSAAAARDALIAAGRAPETPALAVENAGRPNARLLRGRLADLPETLQAACTGPVVIVVGEVAAMAQGVKVHSADGGCASIAS